MCHIIMKTCSQSESRIVKLDYGTRWRRFPQDLDVTLGSTPDGSGRHLPQNRHGHALVARGATVRVVSAEESWLYRK